MAMTMETFDPLRQTGGQQIGSDPETGAGSARVIEFGLYLRILGINTDAARDAAAFGHGQRIEAAELRQGIERDVAAATHDLREVRLGIGRGNKYAPYCRTLRAPNGLRRRNWPWSVRCTP